MRVSGQRLLAAAMAILASCSPIWAATVELTFLLVNDVDRMAESDGRGGYPRIASVVRAERATRPNVIFVHAGDAISPSVLSAFDQGAHIVTLINMTRPDVFVPGNHEFDFGPEIFGKRMAEAEFPRLAANLRDAAGERLPGFEDTRMLEIEGLKVGVVGLAAEDSAIKSSPGDLKIAPTVATGVDQAAKLREAGAEIVVAVAHAGRAIDRQLVDSRAFDLILSGDDHDLRIEYDGRTVLAESYSQGDYVTAIDLAVEKTESDGKTNIAWRPNFRVIDTAGVQPDPEVQAKADGFEAELSKELDVVIGRTAVELDSRRATVRAVEASFGNLVADAMREAVGADVAIMNGGGIRADRLYPAGAEISRKDILEELPFGNRIVKLDVTGAVLLQAVEHGLSDVAGGAGRFPQVSGMVLVADLAAPVGGRVRSLSVGGAPVDPVRTYSLAANDFNARGGDGYAMLAEAPRILDERDGPLLASAVMAFIRKRGEIAPAIEGRISTSG